MLIAQFEEYLKMLTYVRPYKSQGEEKFIADFIDPLNPYVDAIGNRYLMVLRDDGTKPTTMFTAHTDTVHTVASTGSIEVDPNKGMVYCGEGNSCLGADDASGIYIMLQMIKQGVPGLYAFFRGEERGGIGSTHAAEHETWWHGMQRCVSFDRNSYSHDVITNQAYGDCCSSAFADELSSLLKTYTGLNYKPSNGGVYTDSAEFMEDIPECTNISVGYYNEHTRREEQDLNILDKLITACILIDWDNLAVERDPTALNDLFSGYSGTPLKSNLRMMVDELLPYMRGNDFDQFCNDMKIKPITPTLEAVITAHLRDNDVSAEDLETWFEHTTMANYS